MVKINKIYTIIPGFIVARKKLYDEPWFSRDQKQNQDDYDWGHWFIEETVYGQQRKVRALWYADLAKGLINILQDAKGEVIGFQVYREK
jgi:hypothetical protein